MVNTKQVPNLQELKNYVCMPYNFLRSFGKMLSVRGEGNRRKRSWKYIEYSSLVFLPFIYRCTVYSFKNINCAPIHSQYKCCIPFICSTVTVDCRFSAILKLQGGRISHFALLLVGTSCRGKYRTNCCPGLTRVS